MFSNFICFVFTVILTILCNIPVNASAPTGQPNYITRDDETRLTFSKLLNTIADVNKKRLNALKNYNELDMYNIANGILRVDGRDPMAAVLLLNRNDPASNRIYEIYDSDLKNAAGDTPVRDVVHLIKDYYDEVVENDESEFTIRAIDEDILDKYGTHFHIKRDGKEPGDVKQESSDGEEIVPSKDQHKKLDNAETSDGEEIVPSKDHDKELHNAKPSNSKQISTKRGKNISDRKIEKSKESLPKGKLKESEMNKKQILRLFKSCNKKATKTCKKACKAAGKNVCKSYKCSKSMKKSLNKNCARECKSRFSD